MTDFNKLPLPPNKRFEMRGGSICFHDCHHDQWILGEPPEYGLPAYYAVLEDACALAEVAFLRQRDNAYFNCREAECLCEGPHDRAHLAKACQQHAEGNAGAAAWRAAYDSVREEQEK